MGDFNIPALAEIKDCLTFISTAKLSSLESHLLPSALWALLRNLSRSKRSWFLCKSAHGASDGVGDMATSTRKGRDGTDRSILFDTSVNDVHTCKLQLELTTACGACGTNEVCSPNQANTEWGGGGGDEEKYD